MITPAGAAGRFGSLVVDAVLSPVSSPGEESPAVCGYFIDKSCTYCIDNCPTGALSETGLDKQLCYRWLNRVAEKFSELGWADVCGKCAAGPCALAPMQPHQGKMAA